MYINLRSELVRRVQEVEYSIEWSDKVVRFPGFNSDVSDAVIPIEMSIVTQDRVKVVVNQDGKAS